MQVPGLEADRSRHVPAGAVPRNGQLVGVSPEAPRVSRNPSEGRVCILYGRRKGVFRRQPVVHGNHDIPGALRKVSRDVVMGIDVSDNPPAPVIVDNHRAPAGCPGAIDSNRDLPLGCRDDPVLHPVQRNAPPPVSCVEPFAQLHRGNFRNGPRMGGRIE